MEEKQLISIMSASDEDLIPNLCMTFRGEPAASDRTRIRQSDL